MARILDSVKDFLQKDEWPATQVEGKPVLRTGFNGNNGQWTCYAQAREDQQQFVFYSVFPVKAPAEKLYTVAEFITRANYGMVIGNFELDFNDGEVRYKTSIDAEDETLTEGLIHHMIYANVFTMDRYFPGLMKVIYSSALPEDAVREVEEAQS